jgi:four helix bundle protein
MSSVRDFRDLRVWQAAMDLATRVYRLARLLPLEERFGLSQQLRRAVTSVPSNVAEGWGRRSRPEFVRYVRVANGSLRELQTQILLCRRLGLAPGHEVDPVLQSVECVARQLTALERSLTRPH